MIKPMVVYLEVDATLGDEFYYYCFFILKKNYDLLSHIYILFLKKAIHGCGI